MLCVYKIGKLNFSFIEKNILGISVIFKITAFNINIVTITEPQLKEFATELIVQINYFYTHPRGRIQFFLRISYSKMLSNQRIYK